MNEQSIDSLTDAAQCTLSPQDFMVRVGEWKALASEALSRTHGEGRVVSTYPRTEQVRQRLKALIAAEALCCSFLAFDLKEDDDRIEVVLRYPREFEAILELVVPEVQPAGKRAPARTR